MPLRRQIIGEFVLVQRSRLALPADPRQQSSCGPLPPFTKTAMRPFEWPGHWSLVRE
jgi:hypothetical protein